MSYIARVFGRLKAMVVISVLCFLVFWFPGGVIAMGSVCRNSPEIDGLDWLLSVLVPFYGVATSFIC